MTEQNIKTRKALKAAESAIVAALRSQPEDDAQCHEHLLKAVKKVAGLMLEEICTDARATTDKVRSAMSAALSESDNKVTRFA